MVRILFWIVVYILSLGAASIRVSYTDGLSIKLIGWCEFIAKKIRWYKMMHECPKCGGGPLYEDRHDQSIGVVHCDDCGEEIQKRKSKRWMK